MSKLNEIISERLKELFADETDYMAASKLNMSPANLNKIKNGNQLPTAETLELISKKYNVSVDWILGLKDDRNINALDLKTITYEQVFALINDLYNRNTIEIGNIGTDKQPKLDSDYMKVNDPALSSMLRRRVQLIGVDSSYFQDWLEKHLPQYIRLPLLICTKEMMEFFQDPNISSFNDGDWVTKINEYQQIIKSDDDKEGEK